MLAAAFCKQISSVTLSEHFLLIIKIWPALNFSGIWTSDKDKFIFRNAKNFGDQQKFYVREFQIVYIQCLDSGEAKTWQNIEVEIMKTCNQLVPFRFPESHSDLYISGRLKFGTQTGIIPRTAHAAPQPWFSGR